MSFCCNSGRDDNNGCGCYGCLFLLLILGILAAVLLTILGTALTIFAQFLIVVLRIVLIVFSVLVAIVIIAPSLGSIFFVIKNLIQAIGDAVKSNASHRRHMASAFRNFWYRFGGFFKDLLFRYCRLNADTVKLEYNSSRIFTSKFYVRAWHFLLMLGVAYHAFVGPILIPVYLLSYRGALRVFFYHLSNLFEELFTATPME